MAKRVKLTNNADEADIGALMGSDAVFSIPFFQRPYKWKPSRLTQLNADILSLVDEKADVHFLGAVIIHGLPSKPADPQVYEVIDGQQRLTTLYLYVCAIVKTLLDVDEFDEAGALFKKYLVTSIATGTRSNLTLQPCIEDQADLNSVMLEILGTKNFAKHLGGYKFVPLAGTKLANGRIASNFKLAKKFLRAQRVEGGMDRVRAIYTALLQKVSVVQIDVQDPTNGPKIFDSLNSRQEPMTIGDLVRNDVFARVAIDDPDEATQIDAHAWQPFYQGFKDGEKNYFDDYFFPFGLVHDPNLRKSEVYTELKKRWDGKTPADVIDELQEYQFVFLDLVLGGSRSGLPKGLQKQIARLRESKLPSSTYPFFMRLMRAVAKDELSESAASEVVAVLDSFLTRRAVCGHEPTGLHAVFKRLWADCGGDVTAVRVAKAIKSHKTVAWPSAGDLAEAIRSRPIYGSAVAPYLLAEHERSLGGDDANIPQWAEHVLPNTHSADWPAFSATEHSELKDLLANLLPLSAPMNSGLGNSSYVKKRKRYSDDSAFKAARALADANADWTPTTLRTRSTELADWAVARWPDPPAAALSLR